MAEIFLLSNFIADMKRYIAANAKNKPNGSDLNQPAIPLVSIGKESEKIRAANRPAVVPPITLTNAKTRIEVNEPITSGKSIVKS